VDEIQFPDEIQLPFDTGTVLRSYVYSAYPVGILATTGLGLDQLCPHYLQLVFPDSKLTVAGRHRRHFRFFPTYRIEHLAALGYFATSEWTDEAIDRPDAAVIDDLLKALESGRYLFVRANERYMPASRCFLRSDHRHGFLVTGYSPRRRCFSGPAYAGDGEFKLREVPAIFMAEAVRSMCGGGVPGAYNETRQVLEAMPARTAAQTVDTAQIFDRLRDYARGVDNHQKYLNGAFTLPNLADLPLADCDRDDWQGTYGIRIYESFRRYLSGVLDDKHGIDLRATRVLMDHKHVIDAALRVLARAGWIEPAAITRYADVITMATRLHQAAIVWNVGRDRDSGCRVYDLLDDVQSREMESLSVLYARAGAR
jgi:hypothetical protein